VPRKLCAKHHLDKPGIPLDTVAPVLNPAFRMSPQRWLSVIPLHYAEHLGFWERDAGMACLGLRAAGADCQFVALGNKKKSENDSLILTDLSSMRDPDWWKQWNANAVLSYSWAAPRYEPVARAIRAAGCKLVVRVDNDGVFTPRFNFLPYLARIYGVFRDEGKPFPILPALAKASLFRIRPQLFDYKFIEHLRHANIAVVESNIALQRYRSYLVKMGEEKIAAKLRVLPHPTDDRLSYEPHLPKERQIIAVGRWGSWQKDAPRLVKCVGEVLRREPAYHANIYGQGDDLVRQFTSSFEPAVRERIQIHGRVAHTELFAAYQRARIIFVPSRYESFHIAAAEALCCGASVVGSPALPSFVDFTAAESGTLATSRSADDLVHALCAEVRAWEENRRDPERISQRWRNIVSASAVGQTLIGCYHELSAATAQEFQPSAV
jgi:glycosyltransferase involved in cell wall biosynthesis